MILFLFLTWLEYESSIQHSYECDKQINLQKVKTTHNHKPPPKSLLIQQNINRRRRLPLHLNQTIPLLILIPFNQLRHHLYNRLIQIPTQLFNPMLLIQLQMNHMLTTRLHQRIFIFQHYTQIPLI